jgi:NAD(P)H-nitrite reductase large subunit
MSRHPYLIIGNSTAAMGAVEGIRQADPSQPITLVARESEHTYSRPLISYWLAGKVDDHRMAYRPEDFYPAHGVEALLGVEATGIDLDTRAVTLADGRALGFDTLLLAVGGRPIVPRDLAGSDAAGVFTFTTWEEARALKDYIAEHDVREAVVVGGGLIGLKAVEALQALGLRATVIELADRILSATFDQTASDLAQALLARGGIAVRCQTTVTEIERREDAVAGVALSDGTRIPCGLVIFAIGVRPDLRLVAGTSIAVDAGILVDEHLQTNVSGIYAAGDVAQAADLLTGKQRPIAIFPNAFRQGLIAGNNMAGRTRVYEGGLAMNAVAVAGVPTMSVGLTAADDPECEALSTLDPEAPNYKKIVLYRDRIVGAIFIGNVDRAGIITGLIRGKINVAGFKDLLLTDDFGLISLPAEYRKHVVSGMGIEV